MARKKDSKALFEVLSKTETNMNVPDWMKPKPAVAATPSAMEADESTTEEGQYVPTREEPISPTTTEEEADETVDTAPPVDEIDEFDAEVEDETDEIEEETEYEEPETIDEILQDDELELDENDKATIEFLEQSDTEEATPADEIPSDAEDEPRDVAEAAPAKSKYPWKRPRRDIFSSEQSAKAPFSVNPKAVVILIVAAAALFCLAAFVLGRITAGRTPTAPQSPATQPPARTAEFRGTVVMDDAPVRCESGKRDPDRYFLIIETLRGNGDADKVEADRIIEFCKRNRLPADMVELQMGGQPRVAVWCLMGFRYTNSTPAMEHAQQVEQVGKAYFRKYKTYRFRQRRKPEGPLEPFYFSGKYEKPAE
ncbi:MAG: hypothetical protein JXA11_03075 [Phycisphaerae bacterium]|nr:hypothetical protein [Phycisphaerae bacterium]